MVVVKAKICLFEGISGKAKTVISGFKITIRIGNKGYITQLISIDGKDIPINKETLVKMFILDGELELENLLKDVAFEFVSNTSLGRGVIVSVDEIYVEKSALNKIANIQERKRIISVVEQLDNAIVFEDVYSLV